MSGSKPHEWLNGKQVAALLGVSLHTFYRKIAPLIRARRVGEMLRYRPEDIDAYLESQVVEPQPTTKTQTAA
jgi:excisionase family DNA binding protein